MSGRFDPHPVRPRDPFAPPEAVASRHGPDHAGRAEPAHAEAWAIVPPSGALPVRFGASRASALLTRTSVILAIVALGLSVAAYAVRDRVPETLAELATAAAVPLALFVASLLFGRRARRVLSVVFEYSGVTIVYPWSVRRFAWGELVGLEGLVHHEGEWTLIARRGTREWRIALDASRPWVGAMLLELTGLAPPDDGAP